MATSPKSVRALPTEAVSDGDRLPAHRDPVGAQIARPERAGRPRRHPRLPAHRPAGGERVECPGMALAGDLRRVAARRDRRAVSPGLPATGRWRADRRPHARGNNGERVMASTEWLVENMASVPLDRKSTPLTS